MKRKTTLVQKYPDAARPTENVLHTKSASTILVPSKRAQNRDIRHPARRDTRKTALPRVPTARAIPVRPLPARQGTARPQRRVPELIHSAPTANPAVRIAVNALRAKKVPNAVARPAKSRTVTETASRPRANARKSIRRTMCRQAHTATLFIPATRAVTGNAPNCAAVPAATTKSIMNGV